MSYNLASIFGPPEGIPEHVRVGAWVLCRGCSRGHGSEHTLPCNCDLCTEEDQP